VNSGFNYDANGNLTSEPQHDGLAVQQYFFNAENQLVRITPGSTSGTLSQTALYEGGDHRWFRSQSADGGRALITLRDASGQVVADYLESNASTGLKLEKEYVHANGQLVAINSTLAQPVSVIVRDGDGIGVWLGGHTTSSRSKLHDFHETDPGQPSHHQAIESLARWHKRSEFFPEPGPGFRNRGAGAAHTGYSNAVSYGPRRSSSRQRCAIGSDRRERHEPSLWFCSLPYGADVQRLLFRPERGSKFTGPTQWLHANIGSECVH
jgi:hypothetical protein